MVFLFFPSVDLSVAGSADTQLHKRFHDLNLRTEAFSSVQYVGTQTVTPPTDYKGLLGAVRQQVKNTHTRSPRQPGIVYQALEVSVGRLRLEENSVLRPIVSSNVVLVVSDPQGLSERFHGELSDKQITLYSFFPDEYFTCSAVCLSCKSVNTHIWNLCLGGFLVCLFHVDGNFFLNGPSFDSYLP